MKKLLNLKDKTIYFDQYLFISITLLSIMGLVFLYSASQGNTVVVIKQSFFVFFGSRPRTLVKIDLVGGNWQQKYIMLVYVFSVPLSIFVLF